MRLNKKVAPIHTHEGATAKHINPTLQLMRSIMCCMLWEDQFYEDGQSISDRVAALIPQVEPEVVAAMAVDCREKMNLRHMPLFIASEMTKHPRHKKLVGSVLEKVIQRADELSEFLAIYWKDGNKWPNGKKKLIHQVRKGLKKAFEKFGAFALSKYNRDGAVKLRDVMFLAHPKPKEVS